MDEVISEIRRVRRVPIFRLVFACGDARMSMGLLVIADGIEW